MCIRARDRGTTLDAHSYDAAPGEAIPLLKARGLELVTVDQLLGERPYA
jgi:hypothetical protein